LETKKNKGKENVVTEEERKIMEINQNPTGIIMPRNGPRRNPYLILHTCLLEK
jgi:hypothetical protein